MDLLHRIIDETIGVTVAAAPYILLGLLLAGVFGGILKREWVVKQLGGRSIWAVMKAAALGAPLPICSCGVIPTTVGLRRAGAGRPAAMSFLISTPETGVDSITITWFLINPLLTVARPIVAVTSAVIGGIATLLFDRDTPAAGGHDCCGPEPDTASKAPACCCHAEKKEPESDCCETDPTPVESCCGGGARQEAGAGRGFWARLGARVGGMFSFGFGEILGTIAKWLLIGLLLAGVAGALIPKDFFSATVSSPWLQMALMAAVATPLYLCSTSTTPVAARLMLLGLNPGAALILLTLGPATNITTMIVIRKEFGWRFLAIYQGTILAVALAAGGALNAITAALAPEDWWTWLRMAGAGAHSHAHGTSAWAIACALFLCFLLAYHLVLKKWMERGR
jgi:uncharacterized protein